MRLQPHKTLFLVGLLIAVLSFFVSAKTLDVHLHDTYYIISLPTIYGLLAGVLFLYALLYWWTGRIAYSPVLTWTHIVLTLLLVLFAATAPLWLKAVEQGFSPDPFRAAEQQWRFQRKASTFALVLLSGQLLFFINLIAGLVRARR